MSEHLEQCAVIEWAEMQKLVYPHVDRLHAIPNGGKRHIGTARKMKAEGLKSGVPDLFLPVPLGGYHGLYIEMKYGKNKPTAKQADWLDFLASVGYCTVVCWSSIEAIESIVDYYDMGN